MAMDINSNINNSNEELPEILKKTGRDIPYSVPEGYFESLTDRVMEAVEKQPIVHTRTPVFSIFNSRLRTIAASVAVLLFAGITYALITEIIIPALENKQPVKTEDTEIQKNQPAAEISPDDSDQIAKTADTDNPSAFKLRPSNISPIGGNTVNPDGSPVKPKVITPRGDLSAPVTPSSTTPIWPQTHSQANTNQGVAGTIPSGNKLPQGSTVPLFADTTVCRGTILTYSVKEDPRTHNFAWFINGSEIKDHNSGSMNLNTAQFNYGTQRLSIIVSDKNSRNVAKVYNAAIVVAESPVITSDRNVCGYDKVRITTGKTNPNWDYQWSTGDRTADVFVSGSGKYWVTVRIKGGNCSVTDTFEVKVLQKPSFEYLSNRTICANEKVTLEVKNPLDQYEITWFPGKLRSNHYDFVQNKPGVYKIRVDINACNNIPKEVVIKVNDCNIIIPNVFTPNSDGRNDYFLIRGLDNYSDSRLVVTNRNGQVVYENNDYRNEWDGEYNPDDTYFYVLYPGGSSENARKGTITIKR